MATEGLPWRHLGRRDRPRHGTTCVVSHSGQRSCCPGAPPEALHHGWCLVLTTVCFARLVFQHSEWLLPNDCRTPHMPAGGSLGNPSWRVNCWEQLSRRHPRDGGHGAYSARVGAASVLSVPPCLRESCSTQLEARTNQGFRTITPITMKNSSTVGASLIHRHAFSLRK